MPANFDEGRVTRRGMLGLAAFGGVALAVPAIRPRAARATEGDVFAQMRAQWVATLVGHGYDPDDPAFADRLASIAEAGRTWWQSMSTSPRRTYLWEDAQLQKVKSFAISRSYRRLKAMALAWATPGCALYEDPGLLKAAVGGLDWMADNYYTADGETIGNWYEWEVSGPIALNDAAVLCYDQLGVDRVNTYMRSVANYVPKVSREGANRLFLVNVTTGRGVLAAKSEVIAGAVDALQPVLTYVDDLPGGDPNGFYRDGSFIQHLHFPYTGGYGQDLLQMLPGVLTRLAGTPWQVTNPVVFNWVRDSFEPLIWHGLMPDMVSGRGVSRWDTSDHTRGHPVVIAALSLLPSAPADRRGDLAAMAKQWLTTDSYDEVLGEASIPEVLAARDVLADESVPPRGELVGCRVFGAMDRVTHRRPGWAVGLAMCSRRIAHYETGDEENLKGWFTSDGMVWLYNDDLGQFSDGWWPTVDPYRLPGTTVSQKPRKPISLPWLEEPRQPQRLGRRRVPRGPVRCDRDGAQGGQVKPRCPQVMVLLRRQDRRARFRHHRARRAPGARGQVGGLCRTRFASGRAALDWKSACSDRRVSGSDPAAAGTTWSIAADTTVSSCRVSDSVSPSTAGLPSF